MSHLTQQKVNSFQYLLLQKHSIYNQLCQMKTKFMNILCKEGGFVGEICERVRFMSPTRETLLRGRLVQKGESHSKRGRAGNYMYVILKHYMHVHICVILILLLPLLEWTQIQCTSIYVLQSHAMTEHL